MEGHVAWFGIVLGLFFGFTVNPADRRTPHLLVRVRCKCTRVGTCEHVSQLAVAFAVFFMLRGLAAFAAKCIRSRAFLGLGIFRPLSSVGGQGSSLYRQLVVCPGRLSAPVALCYPQAGNELIGGERAIVSPDGVESVLSCRGAHACAPIYVHVRACVHARACVHVLCP